MKSLIIERNQIHSFQTVERTQYHGILQYNSRKTGAQKG